MTRQSSHIKPAAVSPDNWPLCYKHTRAFGYKDPHKHNTSSDWIITPKEKGHVPLTGRCVDFTNITERRKSLCSWVAVVVGGGCDAPAYTDISYVVPPTPVTFLTLLWRLGLRVVPWALGWQSICPLILMASLGPPIRGESVLSWALM